MKLNTAKPLLAFALLSALMLGCSDSDSGSESNSDANGETQIAALDPSKFEDGALAANISTEACTLSSGVETTCYSITVQGQPASRAIGPFCPTTTSTTAADAGIWLDGSGMYWEADGTFILDLPNIYSADYPDSENGWKLYDAMGNVNVTDTQEACVAAANPVVDENYYNHCVQCALEHVETGGAVEKTFLIPVNPVALDTPLDLNGTVGVAIDGVILEGAAPVDAILSAFTIAAFDDCGGHVNPYEGYHYHTSTSREGCPGTAESDGHAPLIGYARDGYGIYAMLDESGEEHDDLDECRGATDEVRGYHYHTTGIGENSHIGCYHGDIVADEAPGAGGPPPRNDG